MTRSKHDQPAAAERVVDVVLGTPGAGRTASGPMGPGLIAALAALTIHIGLWSFSQTRTPSLEHWSAQLSLRVHAELGRMHVADLEPVPEALAKPEPPQAAVLREPPQEPVQPPSPARPAQARPSPQPPSPPAAAAEVLAGEGEQEPADLSDFTFVTGQAAAFVGGATSSSGTATEPAPPAPAAPAATPPAPPRIARPVSLAAENWRCAWPTAAVEADVYSASVTLRVLVDVHGRAQQVRVLSDPGHGLGPAAQTCARRTTFAPAIDGDGRALSAWSPAIVVRFVR